MSAVLEKFDATSVTLPDSAGIYLMISELAASRAPFEFMSTHTIRPVSQLVPVVAQVVDVAAMHKCTLRLLDPASLRARAKSATNSLTWLVRRLVVIKCWKLGRAMVTKMATMLNTVINSIMVMPRFTAGQDTDLVVVVRLTAISNL